jgi:hypothetical protein
LEKSVSSYSDFGRIASHDISADQVSSDVRLEIGPVLFIDIVGYSKLLINEQTVLLQKLKEIESKLPGSRQLPVRNKRRDTF